MSGVDGSLINDETIGSQTGHLDLLGKWSCLSEENCTITNPNMNHLPHGPCAYCNVEEGLFFLAAQFTQCNNTNNVALFCEYKDKTETVHFDNELSDVKISSGRSHSFVLEHTVSCRNSYTRVGEFCLATFFCHRCRDIETVANYCRLKGGYIAKQVALANTSYDEKKVIVTLHSQHPLSLYFNSFRLERTGRLELNTRQVAFDNNILCAQLGFDGECPARMSIVSLDKKYRYNDIMLNDIHTYKYDQSLGFNNKREMLRPDYVLCERPVEKIMAANCSHEYKTCKDGTCIHDSLLCDGVKQCKDGEDEEECQGICDQNNNVNCMEECHYQDLCRCNGNYFQCLSGGCKPLHAVCDGIVHCSDGSDEPETCVYVQAKGLRDTPFPLSVQDYLLSLIRYHRHHKHICASQQSKEDEIDDDITIYKHILRVPKKYVITGGDHDLIYCIMGNDDELEGKPNTFPLSLLCVFLKGAEQEIVCKNKMHLRECEHMYCNGRFKCPGSYCVDLEYVCDSVCDCPHCEEEIFCSRLQCHGLILLQKTKSVYKCVPYDKGLKYSLNKRQITNINSTVVLDEYPVLVHSEREFISNGTIDHPELIVYFTLTGFDLTMYEMLFMNRMISIKTLVLVQCHLKAIVADWFLAMHNLVLLDLADNLISTLPRSVLCPLFNLRYLFLQNNRISFLPSDTLIYTPKALIIQFHSNRLDALDIDLKGPLPRLRHLSSDHGRVCCMFEVTGSCSPALPIMLSCDDMISSLFQMIGVWGLGSVTFITSTISIVMLIKKSLSKISGKKKTVQLISLNLNIANSLTSCCVLSFSFFNLYFRGRFGVLADHWRVSFNCMGLEWTFFLSCQSYLIVAVFMSIHFAIYIPSTKQHEKSPGRVIKELMLLWFLSISSATGRQVVMYGYENDPYNYFCLPFITFKPVNYISLAMHITVLVSQLICCLIIICCYSFLFKFTIKQKGNTMLQHLEKRKKLLVQFATKTVILICINLLTWFPTLVIQLVTLSGMLVSPAAFFWIILTSISVNLTLTPLFAIFGSRK